MTVFSTLAYENENEKKGNPPNHDLDKQTYTPGCPALRTIYMYVICALTACTRTVVCNHTSGHLLCSKCVLDPYMS